MLKSLHQALIKLLGSSKFVGAMIAALTAALLRLGLDVDREDVAIIVSGLVAAIVGQGVADIGKAKAEIEAGKTYAEVVVDSSTAIVKKEERS